MWLSMIVVVGGASVCVSVIVVGDVVVDVSVMVVVMWMNEVSRIETVFSIVSVSV